MLCVNLNFTPKECKLPNQTPSDPSNVQRKIPETCNNKAIYLSK